MSFRVKTGLSRMRVSNWRRACEAAESDLRMHLSESEVTLHTEAGAEQRTQPNRTGSRKAASLRRTCPWMSSFVCRSSRRVSEAWNVDDLRYSRQCPSAIQDKNIDKCLINHLREGR